MNCSIHLYAVCNVQDSTISGACSCGCYHFPEYPGAVLRIPKLDKRPIRAPKKRRKK